MSTPKKNQGSSKTPSSNLPQGLKPSALDRVKEIWRNLPTGQKVAGILTTLLTFGGLLWITLSASQGDYQTLYSGLSPEQSAQITQALKENQIPYELNSDSSIKVPSEMVHEARVQLAGQGLPSAGNGSGFELFDKNEFGMTAFTQKVNYQRAMEAELARTIKHLDSVRQARVHLVIPERSLFKDDQRSTTASVILGLKPGRELDSAAIRSIRHLVASGVEGLDSRDITLVDESGELLAAPRQEGALGMLGGGDGEHMRVAQNMEQQLETRVMALLAPLVGPHGARVEASVELDHRVVSETSESYDPDKTAVRREQRTEELSQSNQGDAGGIVGANAQLNGQNAGNANTNNNQNSRASEATEYEIDKTIRQVTETSPRLSRLSIAVLLDENVMMPPAKEGEPAPTPPDLEKLSALVAGAVGLDQTRGDRIELSMQRFQPLESVALEEIPFYQEPAFIQSGIRNAVLALIALLLILFVARPMVSSLSTAIKEGNKGAAVSPATAETGLAAAPKRTLQEPELVGKSVAEIIDEVEDGVTLELSSIDPVQEHQKQLRAEVLHLTTTDMDRTSQVISQWLRMDDDLRIKNESDDDLIEEAS